MQATAVRMRLRTAQDPSQGTGRAVRWLKLLIGLVCIWAFMFVVVPAFDSLPLFKPVIAKNKELDIKATALFYSDAEETSEAQNYLNNSKGFLW